MSRIGALQDELTRQLRAIGRRGDLTEPELRAIMRAVRLALQDPSPEMLRAGWGGHLNLASELGEQFARDDYARLVEAALDGPIPAPPHPNGDDRPAHQGSACMAQD
ncbi:hypothetical protein GCM10007036_26630 [Alsobacter metallidurans]|uniref:Uncharacterized protein n=1 Tax=Alsobacter metallidurans TaxID=340221 RepID=A0A917I7D6_9HYPH|nr:hypothetical protein [Alsobacter metallidurans]GGH21955.1 hypothetical protein GCM10007036_26630 [Alsobacter metallidurans]